MFVTLQQLIREKKTIEQELEQIEKEIKEFERKEFERKKDDFFYFVTGLRKHSWQEELDRWEEEEAEEEFGVLHLRNSLTLLSLISIEREIKNFRPAKPKDILMDWGIRFVY